MKALSILLVVTLSVPVFAQEKEAEPVAKQTSQTAEIEDPAEGEIFQIVQEQPTFPGGEDSLFRFVDKHIEYPASAIEKKAQGVVYIQFVVNKDGCVDPNKVRVIRGVNGALNKEAIRVVGLMPCWTPGRQQGKPVRVYYKLPIRFKLPE